MAHLHETIAAAVASYEAGFDKNANTILRHAVHEGTEPIALILAALAAEAQTPTTVQRKGESPMRVVYIGPGDGVTLSPSAGSVHFPHGQPIDVPELLALSLLEQATFRAESPEKPRRRRASASTTNPNAEASTHHGEGTEAGKHPEREQEKAVVDHDHS